MTAMNIASPPPRTIPWFGVRKLARDLAAEVEQLRAERDEMRDRLDRLGALTILQLEARRGELEREIEAQASRLEQERAAAAADVATLRAKLDDVRQAIVLTEDLAILQEADIYEYSHPLSDAVAYENRLAELQDEMKEMTRKDGGAVLAITSWTVNGSEAQGRAMVREFSKLMLRAFQR